MLADKVEVESAVGVRPQPSFSPVEAGAVVVAAGQVPERHRDRLARDPTPVLGVVSVPDRP